jgi:anti-sigma factor RsiW
MEDVSREQLLAYLDDALGDAETARIERALRTSTELQHRLKVAREERDRGEHSLGAIWRRERLSCPSREDLNGYLHGVLEPEWRAYIEFHLKTVGCPTCQANLDDLSEKQAETAAPKRRRRKIFDSSAGLLSNLAEGAK